MEETVEILKWNTLEEVDRDTGCMLAHWRQVGVPQELLTYSCFMFSTSFSTADTDNTKYNVYIV